MNKLDLERSIRISKLDNCQIAWNSDKLLSTNVIEKWTKIRPPSAIVARPKLHLCKKKKKTHNLWKRKGKQNQLISFSSAPRSYLVLHLAWFL